MKLPEGVEWALHCTWLLALARDDDALPARRLAEFYDLPEAYLAKLLKSLVRADLLTAATGPRGGFRLTTEGRHALEGHLVWLAQLEEAVSAGTRDVQQARPLPGDRAQPRRVLPPLLDTS